MKTVSENPFSGPTATARMYTIAQVLANLQNCAWELAEYGNSAAAYPLNPESGPGYVLFILRDIVSRRIQSASVSENELERVRAHYNALKASHDRLLELARRYLDSEATTLEVDAMAKAAIAQAEALDKK